MNKWIYLGLFVLITVGGSVGIAALRGAGLTKSLGFGILPAVLIALALLARRYPAIDRAIKRGFNAYLKFTAYFMAIASLVWFFFWITRVILGKLSLFWLVIAFLVYGIVLAFALFPIVTASWRDWLFEKLSRLGAILPAVYSGVVLLIAMNFFAAVCHVMASRGVIVFTSTSGRPLHAGMVSDFFLWHFLNAIPLLQINETLHWAPPLTYNSARVGWILLLFKLVVIIPVIASFAAYWKFRRERI